MSGLAVSGLAMSVSGAIRVYIATLRDEQHISQDALADAIGMPPRTYKAWESGPTEDIKAPYVIRAIKALGGAFEHLADLEDEDSAARLARDWVRLSPDQRQQVSQIQAKAQRVIELGEKDPAKLEQVIERLRADAQADPVVLDMVLVWLDGRRSR